MKKFLIVILTIIILQLTILMQTNILNQIPLFGIIANLGIVFISIVSANTSENVGSLIGGVYGLTLDIIVGRTLGIYTLLFLLLGFGIGKIQNMISLENKITIFAIIIISTLTFELWEIILGVLLHGYNHIDFIYILKVMIISSIYNMFLTYTFYKPYTFLGKQIANCNKKYSL